MRGLEDKAKRIANRFADLATRIRMRGPEEVVKALGLDSIDDLSNLLDGLESLALAKARLTLAQRVIDHYRIKEAEARSVAVYHADGRVTRVYGLTGD